MRACVTLSVCFGCAGSGRNAFSSCFRNIVKWCTMCKLHLQKMHKNPGFLEVLGLNPGQNKTPKTAVFSTPVSLVVAFQRFCLFWHVPLLQCIQRHFSACAFV